MSKIRVILADDHALVRAGIRNALQEIPDLDIISEAKDGPTLCTALEEEIPDLLIVDVNMPEFTPLTTLRQIKEQYSDLAILVISAYDDDIYVQGLLGLGVDGYHLKDQPLSDLKLAVQRVLDGERWISSPLLDKLVHYSGGPAPHLPSLTPRQRDLLRLLQQGLDNQSIAQRLDLSVKTVENHLTRLYRRLDVQSRLEAANYVMKHPEVLGVPAEQTAKRAPLPRTPARPAQLKILLVEDSNRYRVQLRRMIGRAYPQAVIYETDTIEEALQLTDSLEPCLILVDVVLGNEDGIRCTRRLKAQDPSARIVLISAYPDREFHRLGLEAGAVAFLDKKDLNTEVLRQIIQDSID
jgi:DNA-binding NarL/FixJ family response regulator